MDKSKYTPDVPEDRFECTKLIGENRGEAPTKVMIIGDVDSGKTTLLHFLANEFIEMGLRVAIVDGDVGQKGLLPPATVSLAFPEGRFSTLNELTPSLHYFIGTTNPWGYAGEMATAVKLLSDRGAEGAEIVLIDTTGLVYGEGLTMKRLKAELVRPDFVLTIGLERESRLVSTLGRYGRVIPLSVSANARRHDAEERRALRSEKWRRYFEGARTVQVDLERTIVSGTRLFGGRWLTQEELRVVSEMVGGEPIAGWKEGDYTVLMRERPGWRTETRSLHIVDVEKLKNLLVGFIDNRGFCTGLGILKELDLTNGTLDVLTPLSQQEVCAQQEIRFGRIRLLENGEELGTLRRGEL